MDSDGEWREAFNKNSEETVEERKTNSDGDDGRFLGLKTYRPA